MASLVALGAIVLTALASVVAAQSLTTSSNRAERSTGPALVATQDVFASIAEADAASAAVFLSGANGDREQRRLYELALERSTAQLEEVSRLVGDDEIAHDALKSICIGLTRYAGLVEAARLGNTEGRRAPPTVCARQSRSCKTASFLKWRRSRAARKNVSTTTANGGKTSTIIALVAGLITLAILVVCQIFLSRRTKRLLNLPLVAATGVVLVAVLWLLTAWARQQDDLDLARTGGYDSIALTAEIQTSAFRYKTLESLSLVSTGDAAEQGALAQRLSAINLADAEVISAARRGEATGDGLLLEANRTADSTREQAATAEMLTRWARYLETSQDIQLAIDAREGAAAIELAVGPGNADFNGFNTSVESVLSDNRTQFTSGLADARNRLNLLRAAMVALPALAAALALWGFQLRIREYRR